MKSSSWLLLPLLATAAVAAQPAPAYPLGAIVQRDLREHPVAGVPLAEAVAPLRLAYFDDTPPLRLVRDARKEGSPPVIVYMGGFTTNGADILWLEKEYRRGIAMVPVAKLAGDLDATAREFTLVEPRDGELAVVASTADGVDLQDRSRYCYWLRLDDELMKVTAVDAATGRVTVERGFDKSAAVAHRAGTVALGPVYLGNRDRPDPRFSASWPGAANRIRYAVEPNHPEAQAYKARCVVEVMKAGYDGAWWDTFRPEPINVCDVLGRQIKSGLWNPATHAPHNFASSLQSLDTYIRRVRTLVREQTGREPVLYSNSVGGTYMLGTKVLISSPGKRDLLDGFCFEDSFLTPKAMPAKKPARSETDPVVPVPPPTTYSAITGATWLRNVTIMADAARSRLSVLCMSGAAGYLAGRLNSDLPDHARLVRYSYASFLLTVTADRSTSFGLPLAVQQDENGPATATPWPELLFAPVGDPVDSNEIDRLKLADSPCYARSFSGGYVVVNPAESGDPAEVKVPAGLVDAESGRPAGSVKLAPGDAIVLVRAKS